MTLLFYRARSFFNEAQSIYPELIRTFWRDVEFANCKVIEFKVQGTTVVLSSELIAKATGCLREGSTYQEWWEKNYDSHVARALYKENADKTGDQKAIVYNLMWEIWANILNKRVFSTKQNQSHCCWISASSCCFSWSRIFHLTCLTQSTSTF